MSRKTVIAALSALMGLMCALGASASASAQTAAGQHAGSMVSILLVQPDGTSTPRTVTPTEAKRIETEARTARPLAGAAAPSGKAHPDINRVGDPDCTNRNDFLVLWNYPPKVCFANSGDVDVRVYDVYRVDSGNNSGYVTWWNGASWVPSSFAKWTSVYFRDAAGNYYKVTIGHVHID
jgi:hypothetical protein